MPSRSSPRAPDGTVAFVPGPEAQDLRLYDLIVALGEEAAGNGEGGRPTEAGDEAEPAHG
jgi:hypothetical protein